MTGTLLVRPLGGMDDEVTALLPDHEEVGPASFAAPDPADRGDAARARLLREALRLSFRATAGPFRGFGSLAVAPRNYQLVPLMMSARQDTTRLLIADGVGIGKTIEAGLIISELLATGDADRLAVLCSPQLAPQWQLELRQKFGVNAEVLLPSTANRLARGLPFGQTVYDEFPFLVISTDFIKQKSRRDEFALHCPDVVVVDEAHTCVPPSSVRGGQAHMRYALLRRLADDPTRHLLLLTATPHNGDESAWQSLVGLLDPRLERLPSDLSGPNREPDRQLLAQFLVQRQRADIREYADEATTFPTREHAEESYRLTDDYRTLFDRVLAYARETVRDPDGENRVRQRVRWWSAIALLRSMASSPAAAEQTLLNRSDLSAVRSDADADDLAAPRVLDSDLDDATDGEDAALGADFTEHGEADRTTRKQLRQFAIEAGRLKGPTTDAKLKRAIAMVRKLLDDGHHPILFCRYIPTADYLAEHLAAALKRTDARVEAITGTLPPEEREERVSELTRYDGPRVLVATDCLSEGVNLQDGFTAVVHYDLAWSPTRHEQREGRVDRFGQTASTVRAVTYYGADNRIDGVVLDVLIRRHAAIKKTTGVSVAVPVDSATVMQAVWESLLLRGANPEQLTLDLGSSIAAPTADAVLTQWQDAAEREKASRSRFRQAALRPEEVAGVLREVQASLGGVADVERFVREALGHLGAHLTDTDDGFTLAAQSLPAALQDQLPRTTRSVLRFHRSLPAPQGEPVISRADATVQALARFTLDAALDPLLAKDHRPARRAAVVRTRDVDAVTTLMVVRYRLELVLPGLRRSVTQIAEDAQFLAYTLDHDDRPVWLADEAAASLLDTRPSGNVNDDLARRQLELALAMQARTEPELLARGEAIAGETMAAHRRVREVGGIVRRGLTATLLPPPDLLGLYVLLPDRNAA